MELKNSFRSQLAALLMLLAALLVILSVYGQI